MTRLAPEDLPFAPAAERNAEPILAALSERLAPRARVLEIGSGTGQHVTRFARALPDTRWQPSEVAAAVPGLAARVAVEGGNNIAPPVALDVERDAWPEASFDAVLSINTVHLMSRAAIAAMLGGATSVLVPGGALIVYAPLVVDGEWFGEGNRAFDRALRAGNPDHGIRTLDELERLASEGPLHREVVLRMPANNHLVIWRRTTASPS